MGGTKVHLIEVNMAVRDYLREFYDQVQEHTDEVASKEPRRGEFSQAFVVISNRIAIVGEITDDYLKRMARPRSPLSQADVTQRLKYVYRDLLLVGMMSTIEYYFLKSLSLWPTLPDAASKVMSKGAGWERKVHLSDLILWAKDMLDDFYLWDFSVKLRNDIVHFDAIGRQTMTSPDIEHPIRIKQGQQAKGRLRSFISLSRSLENSFFKFVMNLL